MNEKLRISSFNMCFFCTSLVFVSDPLFSVSLVTPSSQPPGWRLSSGWGGDAENSRGPRQTPGQSFVLTLPNFPLLWRYLEPLITESFQHSEEVIGWFLGFFHYQVRVKYSSDLLSQYHASVWFPFSNILFLSFLKKNFF